MPDWLKSVVHFSDRPEAIIRAAALSKAPPPIQRNRLVRPVEALKMARIGIGRFYYEMPSWGTLGDKAALCVVAAASCQQVPTR